MMPIALRSYSLENLYALALGLPLRLLEEAVHPLANRAAGVIRYTPTHKEVRARHGRLFFPESQQ
jgi:hypothetical protein